MAILLYSILPVSFLSFFCNKCPGFDLQKISFNGIYLTIFPVTDCPLDFVDFV